MLIMLWNFFSEFSSDPDYEATFKCVFVVVVCLYSAAKVTFQKYLIVLNLFKRISAPSFHLLHNLDKAWIHNINFRFQVSHFASNFIKEITSCTGTWKPLAEIPTVLQYFKMRLACDDV